MIRFRYGGTGWQVVDPIRTIGRQVESWDPIRHGADGTIASSSHSKWPQSDHGRDPNGDVRAIDIGENNPGQVDFIGEQLRLSRDYRIKYWIHDERMFSSYPAHGFAPFEWRRYTGSNGHKSHGHLSTITSTKADNDSRPFDLGLFQEIDDVPVFDQNDWRETQKRLKMLGHDPGPIDGLPGDLTETAVKQFEEANGFTVRGFIVSPASFRGVAVANTTGWRLDSLTAPLHAHDHDLPEHVHDQYLVKKGRYQIG